MMMYYYTIDDGVGINLSHFHWRAFFGGRGVVGDVVVVVVESFND